MHIIIAVLGAVAGLFWAYVAARNAGLNISDLNPFAWWRRRQWNKKVSVRPLFALQHPIDVVGVLLLGTAKCEGEISAEQKKTILGLLSSEFKQGDDEAADLLLASSHLIRNDIYLSDQITRILEPSTAEFSPQHVAVLLRCMERVATLESPANNEQQKLIDGVREFYEKLFRQQGKTWTP